MGFFDLKAKCLICEREVGLNRYQLSKDNWICPNCLKKAGGKVSFPSIKNLSREQIINRIKNNENKINEDLNRLNSFKMSKNLGNHLYLDEEKEQWTCDLTFTGKIKKNAKIYGYNEIVDFELLEDGNSIAKGGLGRAAAGGLLFGATGAVIGGITGGKKSKQICTRLLIKITLNDLSNPVTYINFLNAETKKNGLIYQSAFAEAQAVMSGLQLITMTKQEEVRMDVPNKNWNGKRREWASTMNPQVLWDTGTDEQQIFAEELVEKFCKKLSKYLCMAIKDELLEEYTIDALVEYISSCINEVDDAIWWCDNKNADSCSIALAIIDDEEYQDIIRLLQENYVE